MRQQMFRKGKKIYTRLLYINGKRYIGRLVLHFLLLTARTMEWREEKVEVIFTFDLYFSSDFGVNNSKLLENYM